MQKFKLYFGPSKSKRFQQVMEAIEGHRGLRVINGSDPKKLYYELTVDDADIGFLAFIAKLSFGLGRDRLPRKWFESKFRDNVYVGPGSFYEKHQEMMQLLAKHGHAQAIDSYGTFGFSGKRPPDPVRNYEVIRKAIERRDYDVALTVYYKNLGSEYYGPLHPELVYLKRLAGKELVGRDLLYCRPKSSMDRFLAENVDAYVREIDTELTERRSSGKPTVTDVLVKEAPTMEGIEKDIRERNRRAVRVDSRGRVHRFKLPLMQVPSSYCREGEVKEGRLFEEFPNPFLCTRRYVFKSEILERPLLLLTPSVHQKLVVERNFEVAKLEECYFRRNKKVPLSELKAEDVKESFAWTDGISYTGNFVQLGGKKFYEVIRGHSGYHVDTAYMMLDRNPFLDICDEILRDAENRLREKHGLPKIGEGWVSETRLFNLVKGLFPDALQHSRPKWLSPQHLDIFVPSLDLAIEYQGSQHFEAVDYFGGESQLKESQERDQRKRLKCKKAKVRLIEWHHETEINAAELKKILEENGVKIE
jgi:hypothetical protein